jgi:hypothetical protein
MKKLAIVFLCVFASVMVAQATPKKVAAKPAEVKHVHAKKPHLKAKYADKK